MIGGFGYSLNPRTRTRTPAIGRDAENISGKTACRGLTYFFSAGLSTGAPGTGGASTLMSAG
jgi:hypothetical protein